MWYSPSRLGNPSPVTVRLELLLDKDNIITEEEFVNKFPNSDAERLRKDYRYITDPEEFSANLHPLIDNGLQRKELNFSSIEEFEEVFKDETVKNSWVYDIYHYLIKDKKRFIETLNKYAFLIPLLISLP